MKGIIFKSKMEYYSNLISDAGSNIIAFFRSIDRLLHRKPEKCLPSCSSAEVLANPFLTFLKKEIDKIRSRLEVPETPELFHSFDKSSLNCKRDAFPPTSITELSKIFFAIICKSCSLDHFPPALLKEHLDLLLPTPIYRCSQG